MADPDYVAMKKFAGKVSELVVDHGLSSRDAILALAAVARAYHEELKSNPAPSSPPVKRGLRHA